MSFRQLSPCLLVIILAGCADDAARTETIAPAPTNAATAIAPAPTHAAPAIVPAPAPTHAAPVIAPASAPKPAAAAPDSVPAATSGLTAEFFVLVDPVDFPILAADAKPDYTKVSQGVNYESVNENFADTSLWTNFYVRWTGTITIAKEGNYTFFTESDDGSRLSIDGKQVVDNSGLHPMEEKFGEIELKVGEYPITLEMFQAGGGVGCKMSWQVEGAEKAIVPASVLKPK